MPLLVRTWNLFHGNAVPPERHAFLEEMIRLVTADAPGVVCLQELPVWALARLPGWSGMAAVGAIAARPRLRSAELGRLLTGVNHGVLRSALTGQANAILIRRDLAVLDDRVLAISQAGEGERRVCQGLRVAGVGLVCNFHATTSLADVHFRRAAEVAEGLAAAGETVILCGDANVRPGAGRTYEELRDRGFSEPASGIDQILVRGAPSTPPVAWPAERRRVRGRLLSDHAPVELQLG